MNYTEEQFNILAQYEANLRTAVDGNWARNPGRTALAQINDILNGATKANHRLNAWCQQCILSLLRSAGKLYFEDKKERETKKAEAEMAKAETASPQKAEENATKLAETDAKPKAKKTTTKSEKAVKTDNPAAKKKAPKKAEKSTR